MAIRKKTRRKRLRKLADKIVKHDDKFGMHDWFRIEETNLTAKELIDKVIEKRRPICGTSGCAAGWAVIMFGTRAQIKKCMKGGEGVEHWADVAQKLLGMNEHEADIFGRTSLDAHDVADELRQMAAA